MSEIQKHPIYVPLYRFGRPVYVYLYGLLPLTHLSYLLAGEVLTVMDEIDKFGDEKLPKNLVKRILERYDVHPYIQKMVIHASRVLTASELALCYKAWETQFHTEYLEHEWQRERKVD
jgi:hypothetical protein